MIDLDFITGKLHALREEKDLIKISSYDLEQMFPHWIIGFSDPKKASSIAGEISKANHQTLNKIGPFFTNIEFEYNTDSDISIDNPIMYSFTFNQDFDNVTT